LASKSTNGDGWIRISRSIFVPILLSLATAWLSATSTAWALIAIPFIVLGSLCAAPNLNLADGFLVLVSAALGLVVSRYQRDIGGAILLGSVLSWFLSSQEIRVTATLKRKASRQVDDETSKGTVNYGDG
jgi:hypothetical protein